MQMFRAAQVLRICEGLVQLTAAQARPRAHNLEATRKAGVYRVLQPVQFKAGEVFGYDGEFGKARAGEAVKVEG